MLVLIYRTKMNLETEYSEIKRWKLQQIHYRYLDVKSFKKRNVWRYSIDWLTELQHLHAVHLACIRWFVLKKENVIISNRRRLPQNRKKQFPTRKTSVFESQKLVPAKHKKSPIRKIKLPKKFSGTRRGWVFIGKLNQVTRLKAVTRTAFAPVKSSCYTSSTGSTGSRMRKSRHLQGSK